MVAYEFVETKWWVSGATNWYRQSLARSAGLVRHVGVEHRVADGLGGLRGHGEAPRHDLLALGDVLVPTVASVCVSTHTVNGRSGRGLGAGHVLGLARRDGVVMPAPQEVLHDDLVLRPAVVLELDLHRLTNGARLDVHLELRHATLACQIAQVKSQSEHNSCAVVRVRHATSFTREVTVAAGDEENLLARAGEVEGGLVAQVEERVALGRVQHVDAARRELNAQTCVVVVVEW